MRAPFSFLFPGRLACLGMLVPSLVLAQNPPPPALADAAAPAAPTAPLHYQNIAPRPLQAEQLGAQDWRAANAAVGDFPRGHADIVGWEAAQAKDRASAGTATPAPPAAPSGAHYPAMHPQQRLKAQP